MDKVLKLIGIIALGLFMTVVDYYMIGKIYSYTILPLGGPSVSMLQLYGVGIFLNSITCIDLHKTADKNTKEIIIISFTKTVYIAISWLLAYILFG